MNVRHSVVIIASLLTLCFTLSGCIFGLGAANKRINAAERLKNQVPMSCEDGLAQFDTLEMALQDVRSKVNDVSEFVERSSVFEAAIQKKLEQTIAADSTCIRAYIELGDIAAYEMFYEDSLINIAKSWYRLGLQYAPENSDLLARLGFVYETENTLDSARFFYSLITDSSLNFVNSEQALRRLNAIDSLKQLFFQSPEESYLLFERRPTYTFDKPKVSHFRLSPSGQCEYYDYFEGSDKQVSLQLMMDSIAVDSVIGFLQNADFLNTHNPFNTGKSWETDFTYVGQWHLPDYKITIHVPGLDHMISIYGLGTINGANALSQVPSITHIGELNIPAESTVMNRLDSLSVLWGRMFSLNWIKQCIDRDYGTYEPVYACPGSFRYDVDTDTFMRIAIPECETKWKTARNTKSVSKQDDPFATVVFNVDDSLYVLDGKSGDLVYKMARDSLQFPYFNIYQWHMYFGRKSQNGYILKVYWFENGKYLQTVETIGEHGSWKVTDGEQVNKWSESDINAALDHMRKFYPEKNDNSLDSRKANSSP